MGAGRSCKRVVGERDVVSLGFAAASGAAPLLAMDGGLFFYYMVAAESGEAYVLYLRCHMLHDLVPPRERMSRVRS